MRAFITGVTGFIGSRLAQSLRSAGHEVTGYAKANTPAEESMLDKLRGAGLTVKLGDVREPDQLKESMQGCDVVFHLAAAQHEANVDDAYFRSINVDGTRNALEAARDLGVKRFVYGSTIGVYGAALAGELTEDAPVNPDNIYGVTKLEAERLVMDYREKLPVTAVRISETYGPGDRRLLKLFRAIGKRRFFIIGDGRNIHQLIYIDDLVAGLVEAAVNENAASRVFVLAGTECTTTREMAQIIADELQVKLPAIRSPFWPFWLAAWVMEHTLPAVGIQPPLHRRRLDFFKKSFYFNTERATRLLGFSPQVTFAQGVHSTALWYRENGLL